MITEQDILKSYAEAQRYMSNAEETLQKAQKENNWYADSKYVTSACGIAYRGVLVALDAYLQLKGVQFPKKGRKSSEFYTANIAKIDGKMLKYLHTVYRLLHIEGYYEGLLNARAIREGFDSAYEIIAKTKPCMSEAELQERLAKHKKPSFLKQIYSSLFF
jgi:hypothetical protein